MFENEIVHNYELIMILTSSTYCNLPIVIGAFQVALVVKNPSPNARDVKRLRFDPWVRKTFWSRAWQPTPAFLPGKSQGQRSLAGYSPQGCKESDKTEAT